MAENRRKRRGLFALLLVVEMAAAALGLIATAHQTSAQLLDERFPFLEDRRRRYQQQQQYQQWNNWNQNPYGDQRQGGQGGQGPSESARAPAPRKPDTPPSINVMVFGDSMAEWLAYGLEEAFGDTPEIGVTRKTRPNTGLIRVEQRGEAYDWPTSAREMLNAEKPDYVVIMLGTSDRRGIREAIKAPTRPPAGQKKGEEQKQAAQPQGAQPAGQKKAEEPKLSTAFATVLHDPQALLAGPIEAAAPTLAAAFAGVAVSLTASTHPRVEAFLTDTVDRIAKHLKKGERVRIVGLGILQVRKRAARVGRNPSTGAPIQIKASKKVAFRAAKELKEAV